MDALDKEIADEIVKERKFRSQAESLLAKADASKFKIATLQRAAALRPVTNAVPPAFSSGNPVTKPEALSQPVADFIARATDDIEDGANAVRRGGRKPGSISAEWREVLSTLYVMGGRYSYSQIHEIAAQQGLKLDIASARERIRIFTERGLMAGNPIEGFEVTWEAMSKFGFKRKTAPDGAEVIEEPSAEEF